MKNIYQIIILGFVFGILGGILADQFLFYQYHLRQLPVNLTETNEVFIQENTALENAIEKVEKTTVGVRTKLASGIILEGSGLILTSDGLVVTLPELTPEGAEISFFWEGKQYKAGDKARILKRDFKNNLALAKIEEVNLPTIGFADSNQTKIGERVFLIAVIFENGVPQKTANEGIVKSFDQDFVYTNVFEKYTRVGSPLFNIEGKIMGLNVIDSGGRILAIPAQKIKTFAGF
jgi:S1-C subfamily serine protease